MSLPDRSSSAHRKTNIVHRRCMPQKAVNVISSFIDDNLISGVIMSVSRDQQQ